MYYLEFGLYDGTVTAAYPIRKPLPKRIKEYGLTFDEDGVCESQLTNGKEYSNWKHENRFRFQNIMANRLNTRRAIRELIFPSIAELHKEMEDIKKQLEMIQNLLSNKSGS